MSFKMYVSSSLKIYVYIAKVYLEFQKANNAMNIWTYGLHYVSTEMKHLRMSRRQSSNYQFKVEERNGILLKFTSCKNLWASVCSSRHNVCSRGSCKNLTFHKSRKTPLLLYRGLLFFFSSVLLTIKKSSTFWKLLIIWNNTFQSLNSITLKYF